MQMGKRRIYAFGAQPADMAAIRLGRSFAPPAAIDLSVNLPIAVEQLLTRRPGGAGVATGAAQLPEIGLQIARLDAPSLDPHVGSMSERPAIPFTAEDAAHESSPGLRTSRDGAEGCDRPDD